MIKIIAIALFFTASAISFAEGEGSAYQFEYLKTLNVRIKDGTDLYLEIDHGDSYSWISNVSVKEENGEIHITVFKSLFETKYSNKFRRIQSGTWTAKIYVSEGLAEKKILYHDDSGLHPIKRIKWLQEDMKPFKPNHEGDPFRN
jgi:hypothetical protein